MISPFTPLNFDRHASDGVESRYVQTFAKSDRLLVEVLGEEAEVYLLSGFDYNAYLNASKVAMTSYAIGGTTCHYAVVANLEPGFYRLWVPSLGKTSNYFKVTGDPSELEGTILIQYSMKNNRQRTDGVFLFGGERKFFEWRVPGGFKDSSWTFGVDNEQFTTQDGDLVELFATESTSKKLTIGGQMGVPVWYAEMLNRILCCSYVYIDGTRYTRKDSSTPEIASLVEGIDSFVVSQTVQKVANLDPKIESSNLGGRRIFADTFSIQFN